MSNRLANETSPYLLQHKDNPVDWFPWGDEAFEKAKSEGKPVFLSIGYSSCHWCHVMEHESFEDEEIAGLLNRGFVSVKVDREERPDIDEAYMTAVQLSSGHGGWPMSLFLTPDRKPFFAGTYFPKTDRGKHRGFQSILVELNKAWTASRLEIQRAADDFSEALRQTLVREAPGTFDAFDQAFVDNVVRALASDFDQKNGGFGEAPKFPPHSALQFLLTYSMREGGAEDLQQAALLLVLKTLEGIIFGGIHDHVGGGFHRYSTDAEWRLPHFEKMLYDNALMLGNLTRAAALVQEMESPYSQIFEYAAACLMDWVEREMTSPEGLFYSAIDADTDGEEGKFYVWTVDEVKKLLGEKADRFLAAYEFQEDGNFEDEATRKKTGANIPIPGEGALGAFGEELDVLLIARMGRPKPAVDDKVLIGWNGLMITSLVQAGELEKAGRAALAILQYETKLGHLPHQIVKGVPSGRAYLDDYAAFTLAIHQLASFATLVENLAKDRPELSDSIKLVESAEFWIQHAARLTEEMVRFFYDEERGGFYATSDAHEQLFGRTKPFFDQPVPSGNALALSCLLAVGDEERARKSLQTALGWMQRLPQATEAMIHAALPLASEAPQVDKIVTRPSADLPIANELRVSLSPREIPVGKDGWGSAEVVISVPEGMHINSSTPPAKWLTATTLTVHPLAAKIKYPEAVEDQYSGVVKIPIEIALPPAEKAAEFEIRVQYQLCTNTECLPSSEKVVDGVILS